MATSLTITKRTADEAIEKWMRGMSREDLASLAVSSLTDGRYNVGKIVPDSEFGKDDMTLESFFS